MTEDKPTSPDIETTLEPEVEKAGEIIQNSDEIITAMIASCVKNGISGEAIISYLVVKLGVTADRAAALYKQVYNAGDPSSEM